MKSMSAGASGAFVVVLLTAVEPSVASAATCARNLTADVVVLDQPLMYNRLGAQNVNGIVYALRRDVVSTLGAPVVCTDPAASCVPGFVAVRPDKRPRPLVLRAAAGDCLTVHFQNLLAPSANPRNASNPNMVVDDQVADRAAGFHPQGLELQTSIADDGSFVGRNPAGGLVGPGGNAVYTFYAPHEGTFLATSHGATFGSDGTAGNSTNGMFAVVNVEPPGASFYRSQVTEEELRLATPVGPDGKPVLTPGGQPVVDYEATYPATNADGTPSVWASEGKAGLPILNMLRGAEIVHSDLNAMIVGPGNDGHFPPGTYPLESIGKRNPTVPNRLEPFREFTVAFHDEMAVANAFPRWYLDPVLRHTLHAVGDVFQINYGSGGVGSEIIANRLGVGPMHDCLDCVYEEFFLTSPAVGDPAMVVNTPANVGLEACQPNGANCPDAARGPKATAAFYPDDPSNVHHSYISDFVKFRNVHTGKEHHIFHLHNHQWLFNAGDDNANYLDAQGIGPGGGYTYEINFGGSGNRNKSAGDAIFHCHFYPHFAQGMWELWRNHDVLETGTPLAVSGGAFHSVPFALQDGTPAVADAASGARARALPDGEIAAGTPIPALVPLPGKPMAPMPGRVTVVKKLAPDGATVLGSVARIDRTDTDPALVSGTPTPLGNPLNPTGLKNPGFPFWIAGAEHTIGQRNASPPLDMAVAGNPVNGGWDGGLPRHALDGYAAAGCLPAQGETVAAARARCAHSVESRLDMTKELVKAKAVWFPEDGTDVERAAMAFHAVRAHPSTLVNRNGTTAPGSFVTNGSGRPVPGAPFHEPCIDDRGNVLKAGVTGQFFDAIPGGFGTTGSSLFNADSPRVYKGANIQFDAVLNKLGYHFSQQRIVALWEDALPTINKQRPPEPFVLRMNTFDCVMYLHTNLVPSVYELDDYQIRTTTDIIGQHIHLPKWDLTTTDGSANGWNYEDGTLSPDAVRERIAAINAGATPAEIAAFPANSSGSGSGQPLTPLAHPYFGKVSTNPAWLGARTTLERWFSDPVVNVAGTHRGLGIIFTHDHFGPSTHQQIGLYATVLVEPPGSTWKHNETGVPLYTRPDGGPTSWQAAILTGDIDGDGQNDSFREFYLEYSDFQHAYQPGAYIGRNQDGSLGRAPDANTFRLAVNPSTREQAAVPFPDLVAFSPICLGGVPRPCPEGISADDPGYFVVNYRNEPIGLRVYNPAKLGPDGKPGAQTDLVPGDLAFALDSRKDRAIAALNVQPTAATSINGTRFPPPINAAGVNPGDPFTPMLRSYFGDRVRVKAQAGGDEESHNVTITGVKWLQGGSGYGFDPNSGWKNSQHAGISEQFTFATPILPALNGANIADYAYSINPSFDGWWTGTWGVLRTYNTARTDLFKLPNSTPGLTIANSKNFVGTCPLTAPVRPYDVTAVLANDVLSNDAGATIVPSDPALSAQHAGGPLNAAGGTLVFNPRPQVISSSTKVPDLGGAPVTIGGHNGPLHDPTAMLYVLTKDLLAANPADPRCINSKTGKTDPTLYACPVVLRAGAPVEPIVLRAAAGECVTVALRNKLPAAAPDLPSWKTLPAIVTRDAGAPSATDAQGSFVPGGAMTSFNNNLIRPSSYVGLRPSLVAHDIRQDSGMVLGTNPSSNVAAPGTTVRYRWYAGDVSLAPTSNTGVFNAVATPVEFGGTNLFPADNVKQGQKGLGGALVVLPPASTWQEIDRVQDRQSRSWATATRETRASATVNGGIRDFAAVIQKGMSHRYVDGFAVEEIASEVSVSEDSEDSGQVALNYGSEPMWFRFGLPPNAPFTGPGVTFANVANAHEAYSNALAGGDPATPVFTAPAGAPFRLHLLQPTGANRASTITLHGHVWQRQPFVCPGSDGYGGLPGTCGKTSFYPTLPGMEVGSRALGVNPLAHYTGAQDLIQPAAHFELVLPSAGGSNAVKGDYLLQDRTGFGNTSGLWGILRVQ